MEDIFSDFFNGKILPVEQFVPKTKEYRETCQKWNRESAVLEEKLKEISIPMAQQLEKILDGYCEITRMEQIAAFSYGFRLATQLMAETFQKEVDSCEKEDASR